MDIKSITIYSTVFSLSILLSFIIEKRIIYRKKTNKYHIFIIILPLVILSTIRIGVGTDFYAYENIYYLVNSMSFKEVVINTKYGNEPLYVLLNKVAYILFNDFRAVLFLNTFISYYLITSRLSKFTEKIPISFGLFISLMLHFSLGFNIMRQMIAMSIVFYSIEFIFENNFKKYLFFIIVASLFHNSAIVFIALYLFNSKDNSLKNKLQIFYFIFILLSPLLFYSASTLLVKFNLFERYNHFFRGENISLGLGFLIKIIPLFLLIIPYTKYFDRKTRLYFNISLLLIPLSFLGYSFEYGNRLAIYVQFMFYFLIPRVSNIIDNRDEKFLFNSYYILYLIYYYWYYYIILNQGGSYPYFF